MHSPLPYATRLKPGSATYPLPGIDAAVMDSTGCDGEEAASGGRGRAFSTTRKNTRAVSAALASLTAAMVPIDNDGYFWILGRIDDSIKVSGHSLSTAEIWAVLASSQNMAEAAVAPMPHAIKGEAIYARAAAGRGAVERRGAQAAAGYGAPGHRRSGIAGVHPGCGGHAHDLLRQEHPPLPGQHETVSAAADEQPEARAAVSRVRVSHRDRRPAARRHTMRQAPAVHV